MKKLLIAIIAFIPVLGFAQTTQGVSQRTTQVVNQQNNRQVVEKNAVALPQPATVILTEEESHAVWLKNNTHFKSMSVTERNKTIQELEQKISYDVNSPEVVHMRREIKWINELETGK